MPCRRATTSATSTPPTHTTRPLHAEPNGRLFLEVLEDVEDAAAVRLVRRGRGRAHGSVVEVVLLLRLQERLQRVAVARGQRRRVEDRREGLQWVRV